METDIQKYISKKIELYNLLLSYIDEDIDENLFDYLIEFIHTQNYQDNREELEHFLKMILKISENHHRTKHLISKIEKILVYFQKNISHFFTNFELFNIFSSNKLTLLSLIQNNIITIDEKIINLLMEKPNVNGIRYWHFFIPEIKSFIEKNKNSIGKNNFLDFDSYMNENYDENRHLGENDSYICSLIRQDSVIEFISYVNKTNFPLYSTISPSIFETNTFLLKKNPTLIEYAAFYGSIQIFQYLKNNNVELTPSLFLYSIHSKNSELIQLLKESYLKFTDYLCLECFKESIKCNHNDFADYFVNINSNIQQSILNEDIVACCIRSYNYPYFPSDFKNNYNFYNLCKYKHYEIVNLYLKDKENEFNKRIVFYIYIFFNEISKSIIYL